MNQGKNQLQEIQQQQDEQLLPGHFQCQCHGSKHKVINNCTNCGRIVCEQEGEGACQTCGQKVFAKSNVKGKGLQVSSTVEQEFPEFKEAFDFEKEKAIAHKDKLLQQDKSDFMQKNVYDEQVDWYQVQDDVWQNNEVRKQAINKMIERLDQIEENDSKMQLQYDFGSKQLVQQKLVFDEVAFKKEAQDFIQTISSQTAQKSEEDNQDSRLNEQQKSLYNDVKQELQEKLCQFKQGVKENKQQPKKLVPKPRIVQNDELYNFLL